MDDKLILYRGDYSHIREFDFTKTAKRSLYGPGIYLTEDPNIASTYRTKGAPYQEKILIDLYVLYDEGAPNAGVAKQRAFWNFAQRFVDEAGRLVFGKKALDVAYKRNKQVTNNICVGKNTDRYEKLERNFNALPNRVKIAAEQYWFEIEPELTFKRDRKRFWIAPKPKIPTFPSTINLTHHIRSGDDYKIIETFKVTWKPTHDDIGHVTKFEFPRDELDRNVIDLQKSARENGVVDLVLEPDDPLDIVHEPLYAIANRNESFRYKNAADVRAILVLWIEAQRWLDNRRCSPSGLHHLEP